MGNTPTRPNILVLITDEHGAQFSGTYGHPFISTPGMDRLAKEGTTFDAAYCNNPLCVPSRLSFMTGQYTHNCKGWDNSTPLPLDAVTWPYLLRECGYEVMLSGKMHLIGPDKLHGFERQLAVDLHADLVHPVYRWKDGIPEANEPWEGVTRTSSRVPKHGAHIAASGGMENIAETGAGTTPEIEADDLAVDEAIKYLQQQSSVPKQKPFALCVGLIAPHFPFVVPEPFFSQYYPHHADLPNLPDNHLQQLPKAAQRLRQAFGFGGHADDEIRRARAAYYGLVSYADNKLERLLNVLDETGLADNTIVIHTSDHGEMLGEHGIWRKMSFYEQSARVPLQVRWPGTGNRGQRIRECCSLVDVTATLIDAAGASDYCSGLDGESLRQIIQDPVTGAQKSKDMAFAEHTAHGTDRARAMLRSGEWKLCMSAGEDPEIELYNLEHDPGEFTNRATDPSAGEVKESLLKKINEQWDGVQVDQEVSAAQDRVNLIRSVSNSDQRPLF